MARPIAPEQGGVITHLRRPSLYYGWIIAAALSFSELTSWGILYYAFSVIFKPLQEELRWNQGTITGAFSLAILVSGIAAIPVGRWVDRSGARLLMTIGSCAGVLLMLAWSQVTTVASFYLIWFLIGITMATVFYEPAFTVVANWFIHKRAQALTLLTFGGGLASVVYVPLTEWLVRQYGWRPALLVLAALLALITIPLHALVLRRRPADIGTVPDGDLLVLTPTQLEAAGKRSVPVQRAIRQAAFWWLSAGFSCATFVAISITVRLIPYLITRGFSTVFAAGVLGLLGGSQLIGRLLFTPLSKYIPGRLLTAGLFGMQLLALLILIAIPVQSGVVVFAVLFGSGAGASTLARAELLADMYGAVYFGSISEIQTLVITVANSLAPVGMGVLYMVTGSYQQVLWTLMVVSVAAVVAVLLMRDEQQDGEILAI